MSHADEKDPKKPPQTLSDADIVSERLVRRRSFLSRTGLLVGGALAVAAGVRSGTVRAADPDNDGDDPAPDKTPDPDKKRHRRRLKPTDPDAKRVTDPDARRTTDPDARRPTDPDAQRPPPPPDPHKAPDSTRS